MPNENFFTSILLQTTQPKERKHLPDSLEERLSNNSSNEQVFNSAKPQYEKALKDSRY